MTNNPDLQVEVHERRITVTLRGTRFRRVFTVPEETGVFAAFDYGPDDPEARITHKEFATLAEAAGRKKARELGWIK